MNAPERAHAILSASSSKKWLTCTPSARLEETFPNVETEFSSEGTLAHLDCSTELDHWLGNITDAAWDIAGANIRADPRCTPDFIAACRTYLDLCKAKIEAAREATPDTVVLVEQKLDFSHVVKNGFGTGDLVIIADSVCEVLDLKFGKGVAVSAVENPQLMLYGLGAVEAYGFLYGFDTVRLTIIQPRVSEEPSTWEISVADLLKWGNDVVRPRAALAWKGEGEFVPGDHCSSSFCKAKATCRARADHNIALAMHEFQQPALLSDDEVASILAQADQLRAWAGDIKAYALTRAAAGHKFKGWKLVRGRATRKYADQDKVAEALVAAGIPEASIYERSLLGITAMEKAITKKRFTELLGDLVVKPPGAPVLVESSDPRAEVEASALDGFENLETGETVA